jgi:hypothetical protein
MCLWAAVDERDLLHAHPDVRHRIGTLAAHVAEPVTQEQA